MAVVLPGISIYAEILSWCRKSMEMDTKCKNEGTRSWCRKSMEITTNYKHLREFSWFRKSMEKVT